MHLEDSFSFFSFFFSFFFKFYNFNAGTPSTPALMPSTHSPAAVDAGIPPSILAKQQSWQTVWHLSISLWVEWLMHTSEHCVEQIAALSDAGLAATTAVLLEQSIPSKPLKQTHEESMAVQKPFPLQSLGHCFTWQVSPVKPSLHLQRPLLHFPLPLQLSLQVRTEQSGPIKSNSQSVQALQSQTPVDVSQVP